MPLSTGLEFTTVLNWDGVGTASSDYTDVTLEAQSPVGTSFTIFNTAAHYLYLGHTERFDMAVFDIDGAGSLGALTWEFYNGSAWTPFVPGSGRLTHDPDFDIMGETYDFTDIKTPKYLIYSSSDEIITFTKDDIAKFGNLDYEEVHGYTHSKLICKEVGEKIYKYIEEQVN